MAVTKTLLIFCYAVTVLEAQAPSWLITAPNIIHLGVEETVSIQIHGATQPVVVTLFFKHPKGVEEILSSTEHVTLSGENRFQTVVKLKVDQDRFKYLQDNKNTKVSDLYVTLVARSAFFSKDQKVNIRLSTKRGYIFIQTDKPIYTPGQTVKYRIFTLDQYMLPKDELINLRIFNSKGLVVHGTLLKSSQITQQSVSIPDIEPAGHWKIGAYFLGAPESKTTVEFEVKEYVLPTYEVKIEAVKPYYTLRDDSFQFSVSARYTYGKAVDGVAYIRFGIIEQQKNKENKTYLPGLEIQSPIVDGHASIKLQTKDFQLKAEESNVTDLEGCQLYIAVTALEKASGDFEEAESSFVKIVTSPYMIDMSKTKKYFAPGSIFSILATAKYPDGTHIPNLKLSAAITVTLTDQTENTNKEVITTKEGNIDIPFQVPKQATSMHIKLSAEGENTPAGQMIVGPVEDTQNYLSIEMEHGVLGPGQAVTANIRDISPAGTSRPSHIYYMVLSKGRILQINSVQTTMSSDLTPVTLQYSTDMAPSFRLVAYYFRGPEIVADSIWVDVMHICKGKIEISPLRDHKPAEMVNVEVKADSRSKVALLAVDSAVYILNKQNKLTTQKMFDYMNSYDLGCSSGGGKNHLSVFWDAGLIWICNCEKSDTVRVREGHSCSTDSKRPKRASKSVMDFSSVVMTEGKDAPQCCSDGVRYNRMGLTCEQRLRRTAGKSKKCREVFLKCCQKATEMRKTARKKYSLARIQNNEVDQAIDGAEVYLRSHFPESWMWQVKETDESGQLRHSLPAPDSITTWEVQAVGISPSNGFCVAEAKQLRVFQDFFLSVKLPYSVKKNEQLAVKAVVFNYKDTELEVTVEMLPSEGLCTAGGDKAKQSITVPANSASSVYFAVVPLEKGKFPITILAIGSNNAADKIQKELRVEGEGELVSLDHQYNIYQKAELDFNISTPSDMIPGDDTETYMSFKGGVMGESADNCLNLEGIEKLIILPTGCAEQTMTKMSPAVNAIKYLDATDQWLNLKADRRDEALTMIKNGYNRVLTYMKPDGSYGSFSSTPSIIWITAFVTRELTKARTVIPIEDSYITKSITYIMSKQTSGGSFQGVSPSKSRSIQGGVGKSSGDAALTAYVLIAMHQALSVFGTAESTQVMMAMEKAQTYLEQQLDSLEDPYSIAITSYALSLVQPRSPGAARAQKKLKDIQICDSTKEMCFWGPANGTRPAEGGRADPLSLETTAYALLQAMAVKDIRSGKKIASWLTEQRKFGGGFRSTQDTVVALEALFTYSMEINDVSELDLTVEMCLQDGRKDTVKLRKRNALTQPDIKVMKGGKVSVRVTGKGQGTLSVRQNYRSLKKPDSGCDEFFLNVTVSGELEYEQERDADSLGDYEYYDNEEPQKDEPMSRMDWFDLRTRRKRQAPGQERREQSLTYTVCLGMLKGQSKGMVIADISLLSGLVPNHKDLEEIVKGTEKYIDHYDLGPNRVYLYFDQITDTTDCLQFRVEQVVPIGLVQPAAAVIYDYYTPAKRCGIFYSAPQQSAMISKLCDGDVCGCAEGSCPTPKVTFSKNMQSNTRSDFACYKPIVDYVYVTKVVNTRDDGVFKYYSTEVIKVLQTGKDEGIRVGATRELVHRLSCTAFDLTIEDQYLFMGTNEAILPTLDTSGSPRYLLNIDQWLEKMPAESQCRATRNREACQRLKDFLQQHEMSRCSA